MQDQIQIALDVDEVGDIVLDKVKIGIAEQVLDIDHTACKQVVHADHPIPFVEKPVTEVGAEKPGSTGYEYTSVSGDRKITRLNSSNVAISYAVVCMKKNMRMA